jgi:hypothetical protein
MSQQIGKKDLVRKWNRDRALSGRERKDFSFFLLPFKNKAGSSSQGGLFLDMITTSSIVRC